MLPVLVVEDRICSVLNLETRSTAWCRCTADTRGSALPWYTELWPTYLHYSPSRPPTPAAREWNTCSRRLPTSPRILVADWLSSKTGSWLLQLQLRGQRRSSYILHSHSQFQTNHEPTLRTSPISPLDKDSYCRRGRNIGSPQIHTGRGSTAGGICILPQSYFLVLIAETLGYFFMGNF